MAGRMKGNLRKGISNGQNVTIVNKPGIEDSLAVYVKMSNTFPNTSISSSSIRKWTKDIFVDVVMNPQTAIDVAKYLLLFTNLKQSNPLYVGTEVRKCFLLELESTYKDYLEQSDSVNYRNFTYFFAASMYFTREPDRIPIKDVMSALLILISKLDIMDNIEDSIVYSKSVAWLSKFMTNEMDGGAVILHAYKEALNRLRELFSSGKGSLISLACLESSINGGVLNELSRDFYSRSLPRTDFVAVENDLSIVIPVRDKDKYFMKSFSNVIFV